MNPEHAPTVSEDNATGWTTNESLKGIADFLRGCRTVVLLTHARPDGDAVGSTLAVARALTQIGVEALPVYAGPWTHGFDEILGETKTLRIGTPEQIENAMSDPDGVVILDTGSWSQLHDVEPWLRQRTDRAVLIDHHVQGDPETAARRHIDTSAAGVCETAAKLCTLLLDLSSITELPQAIAEPLYLGIATDTGWFRHSNVTPTTLRTAADLLEAGARHDVLYQIIRQQDRPARLHLMARVMQSFELHGDNRAAVLLLTQEDLKSCGAELEDAGGFVDIPLTIAGVRLSVVLTELEPNLVKASFRSKAMDIDGVVSAVDVNAIAGVFGGGGHKQASGAKFRMDIESARVTIVEQIIVALR